MQMKSECIPFFSPDHMLYIESRSIESYALQSLLILSLCVFLISLLLHTLCETETHASVIFNSQKFSIFLMAFFLLLWYFFNLQLIFS